MQTYTPKGMMANGYNGSGVEEERARTRNEAPNGNAIGVTQAAQP